MHNIKPNQKYLVVPVLLAIPVDSAETNYEGYISDYLNEVLRDCVFEEKLTDYSLVKLMHYSVVESSEDPEEGELFCK